MISPVVGFFRRNLKFVLWVTAGALCLRLLIVYKLSLIAGDSLVYDDIAKNLLNHGTYALTTPEGLHPTLVRLPGYPFFLALVFAIFGQDHFRAVELVQVVIDIGTCVLVCNIARRTISEGSRAGSISARRPLPFHRHLCRYASDRSAHNFLSHPFAPSEQFSLLTTREPATGFIAAWLWLPRSCCVPIAASCWVQ